MIQFLYVEKEAFDYPIAKNILKRFANLPIIPIERYGEVFNRANQNFRLQKNHLGLILAKKYGAFLHAIPSHFGIGSEHNFYFSHILNCPFDCSYCFLQGLYRSAYFVLFVNYEDFQNEIQRKIAESTGSITFFSGYDGDSLALEPITGFLQEFLPFFQKIPVANIELRTKSITIKSLLTFPSPLPNCIVAYSLNPANIIDKFEKKTPPLTKRLACLQALQQRGWPIGLRFDPILLVEDFEKEYSALFEKTFTSLSTSSIHSVTLGSLRLPKSVFRNMHKNEPSHPLLATLSEENSLYTYSDTIEKKLMQKCLHMLLQYISKERIFLCNNLF